MNDLISIIVPIYQVEPYLEKCIQSIRNQTYTNLEILLVFQNSGDQCLQICKQHACEDKRIKIIYPQLIGLDFARKKGILAATGKYIGYVDGDDWIEPVMYEELLKYIYKYDVDVVESGVIDSWPYVEKKRPPYLEEGCYKGTNFIDKVESKLLYSGNFFEHGITPYMCSKLFLKEKILKYQMLEDLINILYDDIMVSLPCIAESKKLYITHNCYYHYRVRTDSLKRKYRKDEVINLVKCYPNFFKRFRKSILFSKKDKQIDYFSMYWLLYRAPYAFDNLNENNFLIPFGGLKINSRIVLYGAGAAGVQLEHYIRNVEGSNIVCWADYNYNNMHDMGNIISPDKIINYDFDYIIISIMRGNAVKNAKKNLVDLGISVEKIRWIEQKYLDNPELLLRKVMKADLIDNTEQK